MVHEWFPFCLPSLFFADSISLVCCSITLAENQKSKVTPAWNYGHAGIKWWQQESVRCTRSAKTIQKLKLKQNWGFNFPNKALLQDARTFFIFSFSWKTASAKFISGGAWVVNLNMLLLLIVKINNFHIANICRSCF